MYFSIVVGLKRKASTEEPRVDATDENTENTDPVPRKLSVVDDDAFEDESAKQNEEGSSCDNDDPIDGAGVGDIWESGSLFTPPQSRGVGENRRQSTR